MGRLLDTSTFIEAERGRLDLPERIAALNREDIYLSVISVSELLHGVFRARSEFREKRRTTIEGWIAEFPVLNIDVEVARAHAELDAKLKTRGMMIGPNDTWLAATCLSKNLVIVTANLREFGRVPSLKVEKW
ncbi:MAG TPA: PIN domain-containing protein [Pyrinomonadaceae bacterium]|jgi:predicted nucleic acid-binding protein